MGTSFKRIAEVHYSARHSGIDKGETIDLGSNDVILGRFLMTSSLAILSRFPTSFTCYC